MEEIRETGYVVDEAPPPQILELIPDPPAEGQLQSYHLREDGEEVPEGVTPIQVFKVAPGEFRPVAEIIAEAEEIYGPLLQ